MGQPVQTAAPPSTRAAQRGIVKRTHGRTRGAITRLISPSDLGELLKPFVFLDLFDNAGAPAPNFGLHPHSGIATLTYLAEGSTSYQDTNGSSGTLPAGGVEWMRAGGGVWHGGGGGSGGRTRGFQLWIALPPSLELGPSESLYQGPDAIPHDGPAAVLLGSYGSARSAIPPPSPVNYLAVRLKQGERWRYTPPAGHTVLWLAMSGGNVAVPDEIARGEVAAFEPGSTPVEIEAVSDAEFVLGSALPHPYDLVLGYYSVHTSAQALAAGEARIAEIQAQLVGEGRL
jgi:redox-sensitive bicupin YhaK (pirin superfamily)